MITKNRLAREPLQEYRNRDYVLHMMDDTVFDALNCDSGLYLAASGCIDALDHIPSGSMRVVSNGIYDASTIHREIDAKQQKEIDAFMDELISSI